MYKSNRLEQLFEELGYNRENGLFYPSEAEGWMHKFPYWISRVLKDVIRPYAFFSLYQENNTPEGNFFNPINQPLILFFDFTEQEFGKGISYDYISNQTFSFSQAPILVINKDDVNLELWHGYSFEKEIDGVFKKALEKITDILPSDLYINNLVSGNIWQKIYKKYLKDKPKVDTYLLNNIITARKILVSNECPPEIANRLIGRLLFTRYLIDRNVVFEKQDVLVGINKSERRSNFNELIVDKTKLYQFFDYLNNNFKGDLFPIVDKERNLEKLEYYLKILYFLFKGDELFVDNAKEELKLKIVQPSLFERYDFEVIPVELISNIYENFVGSDKDDNVNKQKSIKIYYTPAFLVDYILSQTVVPHINKKQQASCRIFDPSCGSGIFLVESLRKLIEKEIELNPQKDGSGHDYISDEKLWEIMQNNIFGADIDENAIEIAIFSVYITLLDYKKQPKDIENFQFRKIKDKNFFAGDDADFFQDNMLSKVYQHVYNNENFYFDFILGNPPWGKVPKSRYVEYIKSKEVARKANKGKIPVAIGEKEISQAFLVRVSDFIPINSPTRCAFIVTSKNLYNSSVPNKIWRKYFLTTFKVNLVLELSSVNNKVAGGKQIFENAKQPAVVLFFQKPKDRESTENNIIKHIAVRPNRYFIYFKAIVIEKNDVKELLQKYFLRENNDWLWKTLIHGNFFDFEFIKRLEQDFPYTIQDAINEFGLKRSGGLKIKDSSIKDDKKKDTTALMDWLYLNEEKEFNHFYINPTKQWRDELSLSRNVDIESGGKPDARIDYLPKMKFFEGPRLLFKKGLDPDKGFTSFAAVTSENLLFSSTVCSLIKDEGEIDMDLLYSLSGLINSRLFAYTLLCYSSSAGVDRTRVNFDEVLRMNFVKDKTISDLSLEIEKLERDKHNTFFNSENIDVDTRIENTKRQLDEYIYDIFQMSELEKSLVEYAHEVSIPMFKRQIDGKNVPAIFEPLKGKTGEDYLRNYTAIFYKHFNKKYTNDYRSFLIDVYISTYFIAVHFKIEQNESIKTGTHPVEFIYNQDLNKVINLIGTLSLYEASKNLYIQQDFRGFNKTSFFVIKPNERKCWHKANAYSDLSEFVNALVIKEIKQRQEA